MSRGCGLLLPALLCVAALSGCGGKADAVKYNNALAGTTRDLEALEKSLAEDVRKNQNDPAKMKEAHAAAVTRADEIIKRGRALTPPSTTANRSSEMSPNSKRFERT